VSDSAFNQIKVHVHTKDVWEELKKLHEAEMTPHRSRARLLAISLWPPTPRCWCLRPLRPRRSSFSSPALSSPFSVSITPYFTVILWWAGLVYPCITFMPIFWQDSPHCTIRHCRRRSSFSSPGHYIWSSNFCPGWLSFVSTKMTLGDASITSRCALLSVVSGVVSQGSGRNSSGIVIGARWTCFVVDTWVFG
jgi:hypothetical protein